MSTLELINITKTFSLKKGNSIVALDNISLTIDSSDFIVVAGASGSGKSTLLRIIAGLEKPDKGEVYLNNSLINGQSPSLRNISLVSQSFSLYPHMTVFENIAFPLKMQKIPATEIFQRVNHAARLMGIDFLANYKPRTLSLGQCQRIAIARAIVRHPQVFLFDEPLSNLDDSARAIFRAEFAQLHKELNTPFVYVTHNIREAMMLATKLVILEKGILLQVASPDIIYDTPSCLQVAQLINEYPLNILPARIEIQENSIKAIGNNFEFLLPENSMSAEHNGVQANIIVRASDWHFATDNAQFVGKITKIEFAGKNNLLSVDVGNGLSIKALSSDSLHTLGKEISLSVVSSKLLCFDIQTGNTLTNS